MKFNLNQDVKIKLNQLGLKTLEARQNEYLLPSSKAFTPPKTDADGFITMQLWEVMNVFGSQLGNGLPMPFETTIILLPSS